MEAAKLNTMNNYELKIQSSSMWCCIVGQVWTTHPMKM